MRIGELAERTGASRGCCATTRSKASSPVPVPNGYRDYSERVVEPVMQIRGLLDAGLPTRLIKQILPCLGHPRDLSPDDATPEIIATLELERDPWATGSSRSPPTALPWRLPRGRAPAVGYALTALQERERLVLGLVARFEVTAHRHATAGEVGACLQGAGADGSGIPADRCTTTIPRLRARCRVWRAAQRDAAPVQQAGPVAQATLTNHQLRRALSATRLTRSALRHRCNDGAKRRCETGRDA